MDDIYITLPSSVPNNQFKNTSSRFVTRLPEVLRLERDRHVVAVTDIIYPYSYVNINRDMQYVIHFKDSKPPVKVSIPRAQYNSIDEVLAVLNKMVRKRRHAEKVSSDDIKKYMRGEGEAGELDPDSLSSDAAQLLLESIKSGSIKVHGDASATVEAKKVADEALKAAEAKRFAEEAQKAAQLKKAAEEARKKSDEALKAAEAKKVEEAARKAAESKKAADEARKKADEAKKVAEAARKAADAKKASDLKKANEEAEKAAADKKESDAKKAAEEARKAADAKKAAEAARKAAEVKKAAELKKATEEAEKAALAKAELGKAESKSVNIKVHGDNERDEVNDDILRILSDKSKLELLLNSGTPQLSDSHDNRINFENENGRVKLSFIDPTVDYINLDKSCAYFLGFNNQLIRGTTTAPNTIDFYGNISTLYLYCDIVDPTIVGNERNNLLTVIPCKGAYGEMVHHSFPNPRYVPILHERVDTIKIELLSEFGEPIHFNWGSTVVTLHIKSKYPE